jgi:hypothetical protein
MSALTEEFEQFREKSSEISFWNDLLWSDETVSLRDWILADAWYRSRCLELPRSGLAMVPVVDMVNHSPRPTAYYEENDKDEALLLIRPGNTLSTGDEITISYGESKSAAEMLFSYGFIDQAAVGAHIRLPIRPFPDDPLAKAKLHIFEGTPTVEVTRVEGSVSWASSFVFLMCLNEEDGLGFRLLQEVNGDQQLRVFWQDEDVTAKVQSLESLIQTHALHDVFRLRAVTVVQELVSTQLESLGEGFSQEDIEALTARGMFRRECATAASVLRDLERGILESAIEALEDQVGGHVYRSLPPHTQELIEPGH